MVRTLTAAAAVLLLALLFYSWPYDFMISDGIAQFLPVSLQGARAIFDLELPLFNFYQLYGHPIMEVGYYPVLYPLWWIAYGISHYVLNNDQQAWNLLCGLQMLFNVGCVYWFGSYLLKLRPTSALIASLSIGFAGMALYQGGEWFYSLVIYGFVPLLLTLTARLLERPTFFRAVALGVAGACFFFGSNVQYIFYACHFLFIGLVGLFVIKRPGRSQLLHILLSGLMALLLIWPYLSGILEHTKHTLREPGKVGMAKFYWIQYHLQESLLFSFWPATGTDNHDTFRSLKTFYLGIVPVLGILIAFLILPFICRKLSRERTVFVVATCISAALAYVLCLGQEGFLAPLLYNIAPYNWFRHSIKWASFFQLFIILFGVLGWDTVIGKWSQRLKAVEWLGVVATLILLSYTIHNFEQRKRLTDVEYPLPKPTLAVDPNYRHVALWHGGKPYNTQIPKRILGHNYGTVWKLPMVSGYEPLGLKANHELTGHFFPGFYFSADTIDLQRMVRLGTRYIRTPKQTLKQPIKILRSRYPDYKIRQVGFDKSLHAYVWEIENAPGLISVSNDGVVHGLNIQNNTVNAKIKTTKPGSRVIFRWLYNKHFRLTANGKEIPLRKRKNDSIAANLSEAGDYELRLTYYPKKLISTFWACYSFFALTCLIGLIRWKRSS